MKEADRRRVPDSDWLAFLEGRNPGYPETALRGDFATIRRKVEAMRHDTTTPDTRLADDPMAYNPATVANLVRLMLGGLPPKHQGEVLQARVRYFDPIRRRPGLPEDVAALVDSLKDDSTSLVLVNLNQSEPRAVIVQGGAYGEHLCEQRRDGASGRSRSRRPTFRVTLAPGAGGRLTIAMKRYAVAADPRTALGPGLSAGPSARSANRESVRQTIFRLRVVRGQVDRRPIQGVPEDRLHGPQRDRLAGADAIDLLFDEGLLGVRRVTRQEVADIAIHDNHRDVARRVAWCRHDDDVAVRGHTVAAIKGAEGLRLEDDRPGRKPFRPSVRQIAPQPPDEPLRQPQLLVTHKDLALGEVMQAARMVGVQMGEDHGPHVVRADAELEQLRPDLLLRGHVEPDRQPEVRVPAGEVTRFTRPGGLPRVHQDDAFGRLNRPGVDRERFGPRTRSSRMLTCRIGPRPLPTRWLALTRTVPVWMAWIFMVVSLALGTKTTCPERAHPRARRTASWGTDHRRSAESTDELADRLALLDEVGRPPGPVLERDRSGIDPQVVIDRRGDILRADRPVDDVLAAALLRPITWPIRIDPQPIRTLKVLPQWSRPASLFIRGVRPNSPIATTSVESYSPRCDQVVDQGRDGPVQRRDQLPGPVLGLELRRRAVVVPGHAVDRHERRARLDQPSGQEGALAEGVPAVAVAEHVRLGGDVEGGGHGLAR